MIKTCFSEIFLHELKKKTIHLRVCACKCRCVCMCQNIQQKISLFSYDKVSSSDSLLWDLTGSQISSIKKC